LRDLATDFLVGRCLRGALEIALELFTTLRTVRLAAGAVGRRFSAAFPATAPTTPPTSLQFVFISLPPVIAQSGRS
jgi:hypothetical protein